MSQRTEVTRKLKLLRIIAFIILLFIFFFIYSSTNNSPAKTYETAKQACPSELWLVERDAVFFDVAHLKPPYPNYQELDMSHETVVDFACTKQQAEQKHSSAEKLFPLFYIIGLTAIIWIPILAGFIAWWLIEEVDYWRGRR